MDHSGVAAEVETGHTGNGLKEMAMTVSLAGSRVDLDTPYSLTEAQIRFYRENGFVTGRNGPRRPKRRSR